jgi:hypothetical protein
MTDKEIKEIFNIPANTLWFWKKDKGKKSSYKHKIYNFLRALTKEETLNILKRIENKKGEKNDNNNNINKTDL